MKRKYIEYGSTSRGQLKKVLSEDQFNKWRLYVENWGDELQTWKGLVEEGQKRQ